MMNQPSSTRGTLGSKLAAVPGVLLRLALGVVAMVLMLGALLVAAALTLGLVAWALVRGKRPPPGAFSASFQRTRRQAAPPESTVVDVEVREIPDR